MPGLAVHAGTAVADLESMTALTDNELSTIHGGKMRNALACYGSAALLGLAAGFGNQDLGTAIGESAAGGVLNSALNPACQQVPPKRVDRR